MNPVMTVIHIITALCCPNSVATNSVEEFASAPCATAKLTPATNKHTSAKYTSSRRTLSHIGTSLCFPELARSTGRASQAQETQDTKSNCCSDRMTGCLQSFTNLAGDTQDDR